MKTTIERESDQDRRDRRAYRVLDPCAEGQGSVSAEDLEKILDEAHRQGWDLVTAIAGLFSDPSRRTPSRRSLLVLRRSSIEVPGRRPVERRSATVQHLSSGASISEVVRAVADAFGVRASDVLARPFRKTRHVTNARQVTAHVLRTAGLSYPEIGTALAHMDHTSIRSACQKVEREPDLLAIALSIAPRRIGAPTADEGTTSGTNGVEQKNEIGGEP